MNVSCSNGFAPWGVVRQQRWSAAIVFLVIEKNGSQVFLLSFTPLMRPYIVKITWSKFHISVKQWARKRYIAHLTLFLTNLNTYLS
jgi:hypothetical protein